MFNAQYTRTRTHTHTHTRTCTHMHTHAHKPSHTKYLIMCMLFTWQNAQYIRISKWRITWAWIIQQHYRRQSYWQGLVCEAETSNMNVLWNLRPYPHFLCSPVGALQPALHLTHSITVFVDTNQFPQLWPNRGPQLILIKERAHVEIVMDEIENKWVKGRFREIGRDTKMLSERIGPRPVVSLGDVTGDYFASQTAMTVSRKDLHKYPCSTHKHKHTHTHTHTLTLTHTLTHTYTHGAFYTFCTCV